MESTTCQMRQIITNEYFSIEHFLLYNVNYSQGALIHWTK